MAGGGTAVLAGGHGGGGSAGDGALSSMGGSTGSAATAAVAATAADASVRSCYTETLATECVAAFGTWLESKIVSTFYIQLSSNGLPKM